MKLDFDPEYRDRPLDHTQVAVSDWAGISVFRSSTGPGVFSEHEHPEIQVSVEIVHDPDGASASLPGSLGVVGSGAPHAGSLERPSEFMLVYVTPQRLNEELADSTRQASVEIDQSADDDRLLEQTLATIHEELSFGTTDSVVAEALGHCVLTRLLYCHSDLSRPKWAQVRPLHTKQLREACWLLSDSLEVGTSIQEIAQELGMGTSRFAKAFRATVGIPPYAFLIRQRVLRAEQLLVETTRPLAEVALDSGFASQSHMTQQFRRLRGTTPGRYRSSVRSL